MRSGQEFIHWLEMGAGARWLRTAAVIALAVALSLLITWKQFHGPQSERTLEQADVGRQLAQGDGFTTLINYPQTAAVLESRGRRFDPTKPFPELHEPPLYSLLIGAGLRLMPAGRRASLFTLPKEMTDGYGGDYYLLALNLALLWLAAWLTYLLGWRLFESRVGWVAAIALLVSLSLWQETLALNGTPLLMVLALATFLVWQRVEEGALATEDGPGDDTVAPEAPEDATSASRPRGNATRQSGPQARAVAGRVPVYVWLAMLGVLCGLLFLTEYTAGALLVVAAVYAALRFTAGRRWVALAAVVLGFVVVAGPWIARNIALTANPVALAAQDVALKAGDPTAEPGAVRATLSASGPALSLRKLGNKTLTALQENLKGRLWSGGAMWLVAFFVAGWLYSFRSPVANRLRWIFTAAFFVLLLAQAAFNSGDSERLAVVWLAPLIMVFGTGFFFVLLGSNAALGAWPRSMAAALLILQALPLAHDALAPAPAVRFQYPPYFPALLRGMRTELELRHAVHSYGAMADVPAGVAWYGKIRCWAQPPHLRDFYAVTLQQPIGELLLTPRTLDRPFFSELNAHAIVPGALSTGADRFGEWGEIYAGLVTGVLPRDFPLRVPHKVAENLYVLLNPTLPPPRGN